MEDTGEKFTRVWGSADGGQAWITWKQLQFEPVRFVAPSVRSGQGVTAVALCSPSVTRSTEPGHPAEKETA
jgi:hypothetical protein